MSIPATMRALQQASLNGPRDMSLITDAPVPNPGHGEVLIRVTAAGVNFADISRAHGTFLNGPRPPYLAGFEAAGKIVATGEEVTGLQLGARVIGVGDGAFAEYMVLPSAAAMPVPPGWTERQALGLVVNWPTALAILKPLGGIAAGQTVLIHAAADRRRRRRSGAGGDARRHVRGEPGCDQTRYRPCRRPRRGERRRLDHHLGAGVQAPGPHHRLQRRRADPSRPADLRRGHGRALHTHRHRRAGPRPAHRV